MTLAVGTILAGRYRILARLGEGGMGSVYQAEDLRLSGRMWAIKEMLVDPRTPPDELAADLKRFDAEIDLMARLSSPLIPSVVDRFQEGNRRYFVMDFIPGSSLETRLANAKGPLPERDVLEWTIHVCEVLAYVHAQHPPIILRDLKPGNVMVTPTGEVRVIDFGIARTYKLGQHTNTENLGTLVYASPEHLGQSAQTDARSDIYSLGATLYHLLTNHEPTPMETPLPGAMRRLNPALSDATERAVIRAMQIDPANRFQSAHEMANALRACLAGVGSRTVTPVGQTSARMGKTGSAAAVRVRPSSAGAATQVPASATTGAAPRLARVRGGVICPQCGHLNRTGARFCARDGIALPASLMPSTLGVSPNRSTHSPTASSPIVPQGAPQISARHGGGVAGSRGTGDAASIGTARARVVTRPTSATTADVNAQRGADAFSAGRYVQAARYLEAAVAQGRATYDSCLMLGRTYRHLGRASDAVANFERAARLRPTAEAYYEAGLAEREAGRAAQAQIALTQARQLNPHDPLIAYQLGLACLDQGHLAQAEGELRAGLTLKPDHPDILLALGRVHATRGQWDDAIELFRRVIAADPRNAAACLDLGRGLMTQHHLTEATRTLERAVGLAPDSPESHIALGMCYHAQGKRRQARRALQRATELDPTDAEARRLLAQL